MSETLAAADSAAPSSAPVPPATPARRHRGLWWLLGLAALLLLAGLVVQHYLDPWLRQQLEQQVSRQTHGQYRLHVADLRTNLWQRAIRLRGLRLRPAAQVADTLPSLRLDVARLHVTGIGLLALLRKGTVPVDSVVLDSARLEVLALARRPTPGPAPAAARAATPQATGARNRLFWPAAHPGQLPAGYSRCRPARPRRPQRHRPAH